jgi:ribosomal protein S18 acetylase RimI-like enzyme
MLDDTLTFRLAKPDDVEPVYQRYCDVCWWLHNVRSITNQWEGEPAKEEIQEMVASGELYLAMLQDEVAGAFKLNERDHHWDDDGTALYVHAFAVNRKFKGQGIGQAMLNWAGDEARRRGKRYVRLDCMNENALLKQYYIRAGLDLRPQHPEYRGSALFERKLT